MARAQHDVDVAAARAVGRAKALLVLRRDIFDARQRLIALDKAEHDLYVEIGLDELDRYLRRLA